LFDFVYYGMLLKQSGGAEKGEKRVHAVDQKVARDWIGCGALGRNITNGPTSHLNKKVKCSFRLSSNLVFRLQLLLDAPAAAQLAVEAARMIATTCDL
jgi:hypothetical protein